MKECRAVTLGTFFFWFESNLNVSPFLCDQPQTLVFNLLFACCTNIFLTIFPKRARLQTLVVFWDSGFCRVPTAGCLTSCFWIWKNPLKIVYFIKKQKCGPPETEDIIFLGLIKQIHTCAYLLVAKVES